MSCSCMPVLCRLGICGIMQANARGADPQASYIFLQNSDFKESHGE
jgi:hypothetical protein